MPEVTYVVIGVVVGLIAIRKWQEWSFGNYTSKTSLKGQVFVVTGASSGVGLEATRQLLQRQATVIMGNRDKARTDAAIDHLRQTTKEGEIITYHLDLASLKSVKEFAEQVIENHSKIDVLINNAGVSIPLNQDLRTEGNLEMNMGVNHIGHFLLTKLLLQKMKDSAPSRIVIVSSTLHERGNINFDDINLDQLRASGVVPIFSPGYCNSKLANVYHGRELAERLKEDNVDVRVMCPGFTATNLRRTHEGKWWLYALFTPFAFLWMRSAKQGSQTIVYCATEKNLPGKSGDFYFHCKLYTSKAKFDPEIQKKLWEVSEELVKSQ